MFLYRTHLPASDCEANRKRTQVCILTKINTKKNSEVMEEGISSVAHRQIAVLKRRLQGW